MKYINRFIEKTIEEYAKQFPVIMISGARQVGKSTVLEYLKQKHNNKIGIVSLDDLDQRELAKNDPKLFLEMHPYPLVIDEFQYAPQLLSYIKMIVDDLRKKQIFNDGKSPNGLFYLSGSQSHLSIKDVSESLAGRVGIINMFGFSTSELVDNKNSLFVPNITSLKRKTVKIDSNQSRIFKRIYRGSYPEFVINPKLQQNDYFDSYIKTYIEKDVRQLINIKDEIRFKNFIAVVAARTGCELNCTEISNEVGVSSTTISEWISILENTGIIALIQPFSSNAISRIVKSPKIYFLDTGLACYLMKYFSFETLEVSAFSGQIFETYVVTEIIKTFTNSGLNFKNYIYYYRDNKKREIDLIIDYDNTLYPIEIKKSKSPKKDSTKNFSVLNQTNRKISKGIVLCTCDEIFPLDSDNYLVPIYYI